MPKKYCSYGNLLRISFVEYTLFLIAPSEIPVFPALRAPSTTQVRSCFCEHFKTLLFLLACGRTIQPIKRSHAEENQFLRAGPRCLQCVCMSRVSGAERRVHEQLARRPIDGGAFRASARSRRPSPLTFVPAAWPAALVPHARATDHPSGQFFYASTMGASADCETRL